MQNVLPSSGSVHTLPPVLVLSSLASSPVLSFICSKCESSLALGFSSPPTAFCKQPSSNAVNSQIMISRPSSVWCLSLTVYVYKTEKTELMDLPLPQTHLSPGLPIYQASSKVRNPPVTPELPSPSPSTAYTFAHLVTLSASYPPPWQPQSTLPSLRISLFTPVPLIALIWPRWESLLTTTPQAVAALCVLGSLPQTVCPGLCTPNPSQGLLFCFPAQYTRDPAHQPLILHSLSQIPSPHTHGLPLG